MITAILDVVVTPILRALVDYCTKVAKVMDGGFNEYTATGFVSFDTAQCIANTIFLSAVPIAIIAISIALSVIVGIVSPFISIGAVAIVAVSIFLGGILISYLLAQKQDPTFFQNFRDLPLTSGSITEAAKVTLRINTPIVVEAVFAYLVSLISRFAFFLSLDKTIFATFDVIIAFLGLIFVVISPALEYYEWKLLVGILGLFFSIEAYIGSCYVLVHAAMLPPSPIQTFQLILGSIAHLISPATWAFGLIKFGQIFQEAP